MDIREDDLTHPQTLELVRIHLQGMHSNTPPEHVFALDLSGLKTEGVTVWTLWQDGKALGMGALKKLDGRVGEIKSMRTHPDYLRQGVAARLLEHILVEARQRQLTQLSLETGTSDAFEPAVALYRHYGFRSGAAFADYEANEFSQFFHLLLPN